MTISAGNQLFHINIQQSYNYVRTKNFRTFSLHLGCLHLGLHNLHSCRPVFDNAILKNTSGSTLSNPFMILNPSILPRAVSQFPMWLNSDCSIYPHSFCLASLGSSLWPFFVPVPISPCLSYSVAAMPGHSISGEVSPYPCTRTQKYFYHSITTREGSFDHP